MTGLGRLLDPETIAIGGLSTDRTKHGGRVLGHLQRLGYEGRVWGVNPAMPDIEGVDMYPSVAELPEPPDLVISAVPAASVAQIVEQSHGVGTVIVFAGGFGETGSAGLAAEQELVKTANRVGVRLLGPNSAGVIRPLVGLAASFLTCLDRPRHEIRSGRVAVVTQSGGLGSYLHNLAAARGSGLAASISTGNEADIDVGEAVDAVSGLEETEAIVLVLETVRDGARFITAIEAAMDRGTAVVVCRLGTGTAGKALMVSHTGALAAPEAVLAGVLESLGVAMAETPGEAYDVAEAMAAATPPAGDGRLGVVTHSGGTAILLADLAERGRLTLPQPSDRLRSELEPLLEQGSAGNPLDMGGIIGGPGRFSEVIGAVSRSGEYDAVLAASTAHPPAHTETRVTQLIELSPDIPVVHLWMAGDQGAEGLRALRQAGLPVTEEPRAAMAAVAGLLRSTRRPSKQPPDPIEGPVEAWGLPLVPGEIASSPVQAAELAQTIGFPVVLKIHSPGLTHKTEAGGVILDIKTESEVETAFAEIVAAAAPAGLDVAGVRIEPYRPGFEMIVGGVIDPTFGPVVSVGIGGVLTELLDDVIFAPAPVGVAEAEAMIERLRGRRLLDGFRGSDPADVADLANIVSLVSRGLVGSRLDEVEINPLAWDGSEWVALDWISVSR